MKNGEIILCKGIKLDKGYENVLSYNESSMVTLCNSHKIAKSTKYHILDPIRGEMDVSLPYSSCIYANYIAFRNPNVGNKWYFAFVNNVEYINPATTRIYYKVDVFSTWYSKMNIGQAFIEREHVDDDTVGKHTVPENIDTGDYTMSSYAERGIFADGNRGYIIIGLSNLVENFPVPSQNIYNGVFSGLTYYILEDATKATQFIQTLMEAWGYDAANSIYCLFVIPREMVNASDISWQTGTISGNTLSFGILPPTNTYHLFNDRYNFSVGTSVDQYTPVNKKLLVYPYNYCMVTNNVGNVATYNFEDFLDGDAHFRIIGNISIGCSIRLDPREYKNGFYDEDNPSIDERRLKSYGLTCGKFPTLSWNCDSYTNWLTTNAIDMVTNVASKALISVGAFATGNPVVGTASAINAVTDAMSYGNDREKMPNQVQGNVNSGDILFSSASLGFSLYRMTVKKEYAKIIDKYFSRYGYKVNEVKTPNLNSRTRFNYIKVGGLDELVSGDIPAADLDEINNIFRKGVTIFHDYSTFGNYTQSNTIVTP